MKCRGEAQYKLDQFCRFLLGRSSVSLSLSELRFSRLSELPFGDCVVVALVSAWCHATE